MTIHERIQDITVKSDNPSSWQIPPILELLNNEVETLRKHIEKLQSELLRYTQVSNDAIHRVADLGAGADLSPLSECAERINEIYQ